MPDLSPLTPRQTRELLDRLGHHPKRALGQNFLIDANIVRKSLELADLKSGNSVVEVGPGLGTLTRGLLQAGTIVYAIEQDPQLCGYLREDLKGHPRFSLQEGDACKSPLAELDPKRDSPYKIVANLPYAISSPWMEAVLQKNPLPERIVILVQKEMADRMTADPGSKSIGALSIFLEASFERLPGHTVSASCFFPPPKVDSVLFHLRRRENPQIYRAETREKIRDMFTQRRKQIGSLAGRHLPPGVAEAWLSQLPNSKLRPEELSFEHWKQLDKCFQQLGQP